MIVPEPWRDPSSKSNAAVHLERGQTTPCSRAFSVFGALYARSIFLVSDRACTLISRRRGRSRSPGGARTPQKLRPSTKFEMIGTHDQSDNGGNTMATDNHDISRRDFIARSLAAGLVAATRHSFAATLDIVESDVTVKTPDGTCDAAFIHPASGAYPGVIFWADAGGLRPAMRDMGKRIAAEGYGVL